MANNLDKESFENAVDVEIVEESGLNVDLEFFQNESTVRPIDLEIIENQHPNNIDLELWQDDREIVQVDITNGYYTPENIVYGDTLQGNGTEESPVNIADSIIEQINAAGKVDDVLVNGESVVEGKIASITVPTKVSELENDSGYITKDVDDLSNYTKTSDLATVATTGEYTDLNNRPTIGAGVLTIQKNGVAVGTFSANQTTNETINIEADVQQQADWDEADSTAPDYIKNKPTKVSDFTNDANYQNATQVETAIETATQNMVETGDNVSVLTNDADYQNATQVETAIKVNDVQVNGTSVVSSKVASITLPAVIDGLTSTSTTDSLSANQGRVLQGEIESLQGRGRYLTVWNCATGLAETNPPTSPYTYHNGDYFIVGTVAASGGTNYKPNGSSYTTGVASTTVETETVAVNDTYIYDGTVWHLQQNAQRETTFSSIAGSPYDNQNLATALNTKANSADLATVATSGSYNDLSNKPTIPTVNDATLTIQKNGTNVATFTANSSTNTTANITVTSADVTSALGYTPVNPSTLSTVATSGSYNDLSNKPTIPTVNNSTITITQGGVTKGSFTLNQSNDGTIAIDQGGSDVDNTTITKNSSDQIQAVATKNQNTATGSTTNIYDWVGTLAQYEAQNIKTTHPDWLCFITDDFANVSGVVHIDYDPTEEELTIS